MAHTITGWVSDDAFESRAGNFRVFNFRVGVKYWDFGQQKNLWTNYQVSIFAQNEKADYYASNLKKGNIVEISAKKLAAKISSNEGGASYPYIEMVTATVENIYNPVAIAKRLQEKNQDSESG